MKRQNILAIIGSTIGLSLISNPLLAQQGPAELWIWDNAANTLRELDETVPSSDTVISSVLSNAADIEFAGDIFYYASLRGPGGRLLLTIDANTGSQLNSVAFDFGTSSSDNITALELIDGVLYGGAAIGGSGSTSFAELATIDVNTGLVSIIGATSIGGPLGGLAYNGSTAYAVQAGGQNPTDLFTIDLATGASTSVGSTGVQLSGLEFGADGVLYATGIGSNSGQLYTINPTDGSSTLIGSIAGGSQVRAITSSFSGTQSVPEPGTIFGLLTVASVGLLTRRKK
ncbi:MAG: PEP-CTERM sorting domain-containing protein [Microcystaceae cyanobacterium]